MAWTGLEYPWKYVAEMSRELKAEVLDDSHMPSAVEGMNMDALLQLLISISNSKNHGWNPEEDYRMLPPFLAPSRPALLIHAYRSESYDGTPRVSEERVRNGAYQAL